MHRGRDATGRERTGQTVTVVRLHRVLSPRARRTGTSTRNVDEPREGGIVSVGHSLPRGQLVVEDRQLLEQDRGLDRVEPAVDANPGNVVLVAALPVEA